MSSFLLSALPAPFGWLTVGLLAGPVGLVLIGVGAAAIGLSSRTDRDLD
jgi:hypothetical protein